MLSFALLGAIAPPAKAGEWVSSVESISGKSDGNFSKILNGPTDIRGDDFSWDYEEKDFTDGPNDWIQNGQGDPAYFNGYYSASLGSSSTKNLRWAGFASASGTAQVIWKWLPRAGETDAGPVPAELNYIVRITASGIACNKIDSPERDTTGEQVTVNTGLLHSRTDTGSNSSGTYKTATGSQIFHVATQGNPIIRGENFSVSASGSIPDNRFIIRPNPNPSPYYTPPVWQLTDNFTGITSASIVVSATKDNRLVTLSRANAVNELHTNEGGVLVTHGDTIYTTYHEFMDPHTMITLPNDLSFSASYSGNWSWNGTTNWIISDGNAFLSPGTDDFKGTYDLRRTAVLGLQGLTQGTLNETPHWAGGPTGSRTVTIKYFARDNSDGAELESRYVLNIHDPIEKVYGIVENIWVYTPVWGSHVHGGDPNGVQKEWGPISKDGNNPSVQVGHGSSRGIAETVSGEIGFEEIGLSFGYSKEWSRETSNEIATGVPININVPEDQFTYPLFEDEYMRHYVFFRHFTSAGEHKLSGDTDTRSEGVGFYDPELHECIFDEPKGGRVMWAPPQSEATGQIPLYGDVIKPTPNRSGGSA